MPRRRQPPADIERRPHHTPCPAVPELTALSSGRHTAARSLGTHLHPGMMEICWIEQGRLRWWAGDETVELCGGDVYVTWPDEPHGGVDNIFEPSTLSYLTVRLPRRPRAGWLGLPRREATTLCEGLHNLPRAFRGSPDIGVLFRRAIEHLARPANDLDATALRASLTELLVQVVRSADRAQPPAGRSDPVAEAIRVMDANLHEPLALSDVAEAVGWSLSHFKARFRRETGETPARFYLRRRVQAAIDDARHSDDSLAIIAARFGFPSSQYLATCVKRVTGRTPSQLRR
jgi:AraC-like DNA-binding protein/mannose-6-phosphate isomerase-like protein (cupin superfamily)